MTMCKNMQKRAAVRIPYKYSAHYHNA